MKIFGKRTRKSIESSSSERVTQGTPEVKSDADQKVLEELLKQDPSTWNAKQRRMVKRYQERGGTIEDTTGNKETQKTSDDNSEQNNASSRTEEDSEPPVPVTQDKEAVDDDDPKESMEEAVDQDEKAGNNEPKESIEQAEHSNENGEKSTIDPELQNLLNKLSSKPRRKLTRMLEREGNVEIVRKEAMKLLEEKEAESNIPEAKKADIAIPDSADDTNAPSRKRRRKTVDISSLPVEEKLRREEQRRLQKESLERRASGEQLPTDKHRHPLNSERRRANKRKPKYATKRAKVGNEHDTSGFHMRRAQET